MRAPRSLPNPCWLVKDSLEKGQGKVEAVRTEGSDPPNTHSHTHTYTHTHTFSHSPTHTYMHRHAYSHTHTLIHTHTHIHTDIHTYTHKMSSHLMLPGSV